MNEKQRLVDFFKEIKLNKQIKTFEGMSNLFVYPFLFLTAGLLINIVICLFKVLFGDNNPNIDDVKTIAIFIGLIIPTVIISENLSKKILKKIMVFNNLFKDKNNKQLIVYLMDYVSGDDDSQTKIKKFIANIGLTDKQLQATDNRVNNSS